MAPPGYSVRADVHRLHQVSRSWDEVSAAFQSGDAKIHCAFDCSIEAADETAYNRIKQGGAIKPIWILWRVQVLLRSHLACLAKFRSGFKPPSSSRRPLEREPSSSEM